MLVEAYVPELTLGVKRKLKRIARAGAPEEVCGVLLEGSVVKQYDNVFSGDRRHGFDMHIPDGPEIAAIWHSHPGGPTGPSTDDLQAMCVLASRGHDFPWIIITSQSVSAWKLSLAPLP